MTAVDKKNLVLKLIVNSEYTIFIVDKYVHCLTKSENNCHVPFNFMYYFKHS